MKHILALGFATFVLVSQSTRAQTSVPPQPASITISTQQDAKVAPDRATISISVQTKAKTAAAAAANNAKKQTEVISALHSIGLSNDRLSTSGYFVQPDYRYEQNKEPQLVGYTATNSITVEIRDMQSIGKVIDAALGAGANQIGSPEFYASNTDSARQQALATAIAKARVDAQVAARAAGGTLGELLEMNVTSDRILPPPGPIMFKAMASDAAGPTTPITPGNQTMTVSVSTRWKFVPGNP
jgi:uncharacterized protein YggE